MTIPSGTFEHETERLLELAPDDLYIRDICRTFETSQLAELSQSFFELMVLTALFFERLRGSDLVTKYTQIAELGRTLDKRNALLPWQWVYAGGRYFTAGIPGSISKSSLRDLKKDLLDNRAALDLIGGRKELNKALASSYTELGAILTLLREAINQDSHVSSVTMGGGVMVAAGPLKIVEVAERIILLSEGLVGCEIFEGEEYGRDKDDLVAKIGDECRPAVLAFKSLIDGAEIRRLLLQGVNGDDKSTKSRESRLDGFVPGLAAQDSELKVYVGNLVELISRNSSLLKEEISNSSLLLAGVVERVIERSVSGIKDEVAILGTRVAAASSKNEWRSPQIADSRRVDSHPPRALVEPPLGQIEASEAAVQFESLKRRIMRDARSYFGSKGRPVEYYHCVVNRTMYEEFLCNRIRDVRSAEAAGLIQRLIVSRNPRHADVVDWQIEKYGDAINAILSNVEYPPIRTEGFDNDEIPF